MSNRDNGVVWFGSVRWAWVRCGGLCFTKVTLLLFKKGEQYGRFRSMFS